MFNFVQVVCGVISNQRLMKNVYTLTPQAKTNRRKRQAQARRDNMKKYKLSITLGDKSYICNNINDEDVIIKEFEYYDQASNYIDNNFTKIKEGWNYNYYIKKQASEQKG